MQKIIILASCLVFLCFPAFAGDEKPPVPKEEVERLRSLPWYEDGFSLDSLPVAFDDEKNPKVLERYCYSSYKKELSQCDTKKLLVTHSERVDINGDEFPDLVVETETYSFESSARTLTFYAGCGNGFYLEVLAARTNKDAPGKGYTLLDPVERNGIAWKVINAPDYREGMENRRAFYHFSFTGYVRAEAVPIAALPFVNDNATFIDLGSDDFAHDVEKYRLYINPESGYLPTLRPKGAFLSYMEEALFEMDKIDLNGDDYPDLVVRHTYEGRTLLHTFLAGCGNDWYMVVFQTTAPVYKLGPPTQTNNGVGSAQTAWKAIMIPPGGPMIKPESETLSLFLFRANPVFPTVKDAPESSYERFTFGVNGYIPADADQAFVNGLARTPWVRSRTPRSIVRPRPTAERFTASGSPISPATTKKARNSPWPMKVFHPGLKNTTT